MDLLSSRLLTLFLALSHALLFCQAVSPTQNSESDEFATIQVLVRDGDGHPVTGLEPANFLVNENGKADLVIMVRRLEEPDSSNSIRATNTVTAPSSSPQQESSAIPTTRILLILAPMSATGRNASITDLQKFLKQPHPSNWSFALFDDAGQFLPFSENVEPLRARLNTLEHKLSPPQFIGGTWVPQAIHVIAEMGTRPGRRAIILASDFGSDPSTYGEGRLRVDPSIFVDAAVRTQAPMYTLQASGPGVVIPYGKADRTVAERTQAWTSLEARLLAERTNSEISAVGKVFSDFAWSAYETGGRPARTMQDAFAKIAADSAGIYEITFRPQLLDGDGSWRSVNVEVRSPRVHFHSVTHYIAPIAENRLQIPPAMLAALKANKEATSVLDAAAHVWLFPDHDGASTAVLAADIGWKLAEQPNAPNSKLQIYAQLIDQNLGRAVGSWLSDRAWDSVDNSIHWQREVLLYPGSYTLQLFAFEPTSNRVVKRTFSFTAHPVDGNGGVRISHTLIADRCLADDERDGRVNLFDPAMLDGCQLAPSASGSFSADDQLDVLVRFYPDAKIPGSTILKQWKAYVTVGNSPLIPLTITAGAVRGFIASTRLDLGDLKFKPGKYQVSVGVDVGGREPVFAPPGEITIRP